MTIIFSTISEKQVIKIKGCDTSKEIHKIIAEITTKSKSDISVHKQEHIFKFLICLASIP